MEYLARKMMEAYLKQLPRKEPDNEIYMILDGDVFRPLEKPREPRICFDT
jgi:hypothetical protein